MRKKCERAWKKIPFPINDLKVNRWVLIYSIKWSCKLLGVKNRSLIILTQYDELSAKCKWRLAERLSDIFNENKILQESILSKYVNSYVQTVLRLIIFCCQWNKAQILNILFEIGFGVYTLTWCSSTPLLNGLKNLT